jgi:hypothetical protein
MSLTNGDVSHPKEESIGILLHVWHIFPSPDIP